MMRKTILAGVLLLAAAPMALAQPAPPPPPPGGPDAGPRAEERGDRERADRGERRERERGERGERGRDRGPDREHGERRGPPHGAGGHGREAGASFRIDLGPSGSLTVRCGEEELRPCVEAARPLIDAVSERAGPGAGPGPAPSLAPPPPAAGDELDVPLPEEVSPDEPPVLPDGLAGEGEPAPAN